MTGQLDAVTGAFGYSGSRIARELLGAGHAVRTLTGHPHRAPAGTPIDVRALQFTDRDQLTSDLRGVDTLYNTYWIRFPHGPVDHDRAVADSRVLFEAAVAAGVRRIVHVSITHPSPDSPYAYFRGKALVEQILVDTAIPAGLSYAIARPAILFGGDGVLINNIAWLLRHLPVFAIGGDGTYRVRGIHVADLARLCVRLGGEDTDTVTDAVGPQSLSFDELVAAIRTAVGSRAIVINVPPAALTRLSTALGLVLRDTLLTTDEYEAMAGGLADSDAPATGSVRFSDWVARHSDRLGRTYANELKRHFDAPSPAGHQRLADVAVGRDR